MINWVCHEVNCRTWSRGYARLCDPPKTSSSHRLAFRCVAWLHHHRSHFDRLFFFLTCWGVQKTCRTISAKIEISAKLLRILRQMVIECNWIWTAGKLILNSHFQSYSHQNLWNSVWGSGLKILSWKWKRWNCKIPRLIPEFYQFDTFFQIMHPPWNFQVSEIHFDITSTAVKTLYIILRIIWRTGVNGLKEIGSVRNDVEKIP